jgi:hypothetical protein
VRPPAPDHSPCTRGCLRVTFSCPDHRNVHAQRERRAVMGVSTPVGVLLLEQKEGLSRPGSDWVSRNRGRCPFCLRPSLPVPPGSRELPLTPASHHAHRLSSLPLSPDPLLDRAVCPTPLGPDSSHERPFDYDTPAPAGHGSSPKKARRGRSDGGAVRPLPAAP